MASEITERTGKPKNKIKNASKVIRTDIFMEEVQKYVCLYDKYSRDFKDRNMKVNCWDKVASKFDLTPQQAETKFRNVRTAYTRFLRKKKTVPSGSGREASKVPTEFENLEWLSSYIDHRPTCNNMSEQDEESGEVKSSSKHASNRSLSSSLSVESDDDEAETLPEDDDQDEESEDDFERPNTDSQDIELEPLEDQVKSYEPAQEQKDPQRLGKTLSDPERPSATLKDPQRP